MDGIVGNAGYFCSISNCINEAPINGNYNVGGIAGLVTDEGSQIVKTTNNGPINGKYYVGGIAGQARMGAQIFSSTNDGKVNTEGSTKISWETGTKSWDFNLGVLGGIAGYCDEATIESCYNNNQLHGVSNSNQGVAAGGIAGIAWNGSKIIKCQNGSNGTVGTTENASDNSCFLGGIVGNLGYSDIEESFNKGQISMEKGKGTVGGIVGYGWSFRLSNCYNLGILKSDVNAVGGIIAFCNKYVDDNKKNYAYNCYNASVNITGGVAGNWGGNIEYLEGEKNASVTGYTNIGKGSNVNNLGISNYKQEEMQSEAFLNYLNKNNGAELWLRNTNINGGYPYLTNNVPK